MSKQRVIVLSVVHQGLTPTQAAEKFGVTRQWVHALLTRYKTLGIEAIEPRSRKPKTTPRVTPQHVQDLIIELRHQLTLQGFDAGPITIQTHLKRQGFTAPSTSTIRRILKKTGLITPEPHKRPKSSLTRFQADQPNETWQSDITHWALPDTTVAHIIGWIDDHSRYLLHLSAHTRQTGDIVTTSFTHTTNEHGYPASTLTDNGNVYTTRYAGGAQGKGTRNAFETLLDKHNITQKNGRPYKPTTQGKIERFWQTLKKHLTAKNPANMSELQNILNTFRTYYNTERPHRALEGQTPHDAYNMTLKATPTRPTRDTTEYRTRTDIVDNHGKISLRHAGILHHLGIGRKHARTPVLILIDKTTVTVTHKNTGEIFSTHTINPTTNYWRNTLNPPDQ